MALFRIFLICLIAANFPGTSTFTPVISPFDISIYNNTCISTDNNVTTLDCDACTDFYVIVKTAMLYACTRDEEAANKTVELITEYETKWYPGRTYGIVMSLNTVKLIKQMTNLYSYIDIYRGYVSEKINETTQVRGKLNFFDLETSLPPLQNQTNNLIFILQDYILNIKALKLLTLKYRLDNIFLTEIYRNEILNETIYSEFIEMLNNSLPTQKFASMTNLALFKLWPTFMGGTFILGIISNGLLLLIFLRHAEIRTIHNVMLANLAFIDLISLIFNLPLTYIMYSKPWKFNLLACQCFLFIRYVTLGVSTYSIVVISFQRYSAVSKFRTNRTTRLNSTLLLAGLWSIVVLYAVPAIIFAKTEQEYCKYAEDVFLYHASVELAVMCIFPVVLVSVFSTMASIRLKKSAENIPGEKMGQEKRIRDRIITSRVLIGLVVIFVSTYLPKYLFDVLITVDQSVRNTYDYRSDEWGLYFILSLFIEVLLFLNAALNPVVLYFLSTKFKTYFNNYILCKCQSQIN